MRSPVAGAREGGERRAARLDLPAEPDLDTAAALRPGLLASVAALPARGAAALDPRSTTYLAGLDSRLRTRDAVSRS